ncbi:PDR/VanB family oxidoreductase [Williamsia muralis]|uniref:Oxidoreductase n=1 Tax=Williamsia marianensis TaxID=85044 RepID=A0A2G3PTK1_WILMA|nr:PDR/VanB family oxidoreductase [Williamsia marianensis]PHV69091.1 oxidoreductase [Williamsia marianensis]
MTHTVNAPPAGLTGTDLLVTVGTVRELCDGIREVTFTGAQALPSFTPGSHVGVRWGTGVQNSYSLTGPCTDPDHYAICVRRDDAGRGGSAWIHALRVGDQVVITPPRSAFAPISVARHHVLIAGGIGVTPILSHVRAAVQWHRSFEVIYSHRPGQDALADELQNLCGDRLTIVHDVDDFRSHLTPILEDSVLGTHLYTCGPAMMIDAVAAAATAAGWPAQRIHSEQFSSAVATGGAPFAARLRRTGVLVPVGADVSLLEALLERGVAVPNLCRQGVCGECRVTVRGGRIDHRDFYLSDDERAEGDAMMPCVSRAAGDQVELEL